MNVDTLIAGALGIGPAILVLWYGLRRFDYPYVEKTLFDDRKVFVLFAVGMVFGAISGMFGYAIIAATASIIVLVSIVIALLEESFKMVVLNLKRFRLKFDTTFYGVSLGCGMGSVMVVSYAYSLFISNPNSATSPGYLLPLLGLSVGLCSLEASTGALIGYGSFKGRSWYFLLQAMIYRVFFAVIILPFRAGPQGGVSPFLSILSLIAAIIFSLLLYWRIYVGILPYSLPEEIRRKLRRKLRKLKIGSKD